MVDPTAAAASVVMPAEEDEEAMLETRDTASA